MIALSGQFHLRLGCHIYKLENLHAAASAFPAPAVAGCTLASPAAAAAAAAAAATDIAGLFLFD